jgi:hypothetical protein
LIWDQRRVLVLQDTSIAGMQLRMIDVVRRAEELPVLRNLRAGNYESRAARHRAFLPTLTAKDEAWVRRLDAEGVASRRVHMGGEVNRDIARAVGWLRDNRTSEPVTYLPLDQPNLLGSLYRWGFDQNNLDIAERHIRLPVRYVGMEVKVERASAPPARQQVRYWHLDAEDRRMLKIIVYLNDVDSGNGPFEYLSPPLSELARRRLRCRPGVTFLADEAIAAVAPAPCWHQVTGPARTAVYADTGRLIHRLKAPTDRDRYSATFVYTSDKPYSVFSRFMPPRTFVDAVAETLTPRQRRALPEPSWQRPPAQTFGPREHP